MRDDGRRWVFNPWWYAIYFVALVFQPLFDPTAGIFDWLVIAVLLVLGIGIYWLGYTHPRYLLLAAIAMTVTGAVGVFFNAGASGYLVYAAAFAGRLEPRRVAQRWIAGLFGVLLVLAAVSPVPMPYRLLAFVFPVVLVWIVGYEVMDVAEREREASRLRVDNVRIERLATLGERERIARDLHDLLGHTLTGIVVRAQLVRRLAASDPLRAAREASDIEDLARGALDEVRSAVSGWRHHALDAEIDAARGALAAAGVALDVTHDEDISLTSAVEAALALAVREAVTNVVRHAGAYRCRIEITASGDDVLLVVSDDGRGGTASDGGGLTGMRERVAALGGRIDRDTDRGTTLTVTVPAQGVTA